MWNIEFYPGHPRLGRRAARVGCAAFVALASLTAGAIVGADAAGAATASAGLGAGSDALAEIHGGVVRGAAIAGGYAFRGLPYAAAPTGEHRWRPPRPPADWDGVRDATGFAPACPQPTAGNPTAPPGAMDEDCLYLNVYTPAPGNRHGAGRPVLVWIHGGGFTQDAARNYDGSMLAAEGTVVVTIDYRLGALGFLAHPALSTRPGGPAGNYGLMDQQAALRWVRHNIAQFGGDPHNVTIAGESAGATAVLAHLVSRGSRGLFDRAIVQSGAFALDQQPLADAEASGEAFAARVGCADQSASCLRGVPAADLVHGFEGIPGVVDGDVLRESLGSALAAGRFARVPVLNGSNHDEERIFISIGRAVTLGHNVPATVPAPADYQSAIASVLGLPEARAASVAAEYPIAAYPTARAAFSTLIADANFACPALQVDRWTSSRTPTFAYEFNDDDAPQLFAPPGLIDPVATHGSEIPYVLDEPNAPVPAVFNPAQQQLAAAMRAAWASFAADGQPAGWPAFDGADEPPVMSLVVPAPQVETTFAAAHHCAFWAQVPLGQGH